MDQDQLQTILEFYEKNKLSNFKYSDENIFVHIVNDSNVSTVSENCNKNEESTVGKTSEVSDKKNLINDTVVKSPLVGIFHIKSEETGKGYVNLHQHINCGDVIGVIEAMKMFSEVKSTVDGKITKVLVADNEMVEYNQSLIMVETD